VRVNSNLFWILAAFFAAADVLYIVWHLIEYSNSEASAQSPQTPIEWVGTVGIGLAAIFGALIAFYVGATRRAQGGELPEDRVDADIDDGDPEIGYFSPWSWWPMLLALGTGLAFLGFAVGIWITFIGVPIALLAVIGWYYEYYRNYFAR
jgi:hypothetical protein